MPVNLHYGAPGSYKTSGALLDDLPKAVKEGRVLITNIRGLDDAERTKEILLKEKKPVNDDFRIIHFDTRKEEEKEKLRKFFHWAPQDAYFIIDEINTIYPKKWTEKVLEEYALHKGTPEDLENKKNHLVTRNKKPAYDQNGDVIIRPENLTEALEMHRHYNWDFSLTSPSYKKFHPVFHDVAEIAYKHTNRAIIGVKGSYWETMHEASNAGTARADQLLTQVRKIPKYIFSLYKSTATGQVRDTSAGKNVFMQVKVFVVVGLVLSLLGYSYYELNRLNFFGKSTDTETGTIPDNQVTPKTNPNYYQKTSLHNIQNQRNNNTDFDPQTYSKSTNNTTISAVASSYLQDYKIHLSGTLWKERLVTIKKGDKQRQISSKLLKKLGYTITYIDECFATLSHPEEGKRILTCPYKNQDNIGLETAKPIIKNPFQ